MKVKTCISRMRETCTKNTFREESADIKFLPRSEVSGVNYDCSFKIHLPVGRKISLNISVIAQLPPSQVRRHLIKMFTDNTNTQTDIVREFFKILFYKYNYQQL